MSISTIQNFYKETITRAVTLTGATNIYVSALPTPDEGYVVISPSSSSLREIVYYTAKGTDSNGSYLTVTLANRGLGGTTAQTHAIGEPVRMNVTAEHIKEISDAIDQIVAAGAQDASTITKGIGKVSVAPASATNPIFVGDNDPRISPADRGDGSDGDVTISSGTTTLTRDMFYNNLTVNGTGILNTASFRFFVKGTFTVDSTGGAYVHNNGGDGGDGNNAGGIFSTTLVAGTAGAQVGAGSLPQGAIGKVGALGINSPDSSPRNGNNGNAGDDKTHTIVNLSGSAGGNGSSYGSPTGGIAGTATTSINIPRNSISAYYLIDLTSTTALQQLTVNAGSGSGASGGSGIAGKSGSGGGSGAGGGIVWFSAGVLNLTGTACIQAKGGNGGKGGDSDFGLGAGGGGGGGNGGVIFAIYGSKTGTGTMVATGGTAGEGGGGGAPGTAGGAGNDGLVIEIN